MEKNKLGIVINTTKANNRTSGFRAIYRFNDDEWSSVVRDTGAELKKVTNNSASVPIHFIQFESNGCFYCIMQPIAGRNDYQSAWIFIHKDILLPNGELSSIIQKVEEILSFDVEDKKVELDNLFEKPYQTTNNPSYSVSSGDTYAVRYYGKGTELVYTQSSILEDYLYQSEYSKYKSVFLIDKESGLQVSDAHDLSNTRLEKCFVIDLPAELYGFKHNLGTDSLRVTEGTLVRVIWTRSGYVPVEKQGTCSKDLLIQKEDCRRSFRLELFRVVDKVTGKTLKVRPIFIGKHWVDDSKNPTVFYFREDDLNCVSCRVDLQTYEPFNGTLDLTQPNEKGEFVIELQPENHEYKCCIETKIPDVRTIEFVIKTQYKLKGSEIPGFQFEGTPSETRTNRLKGAHKQAAMPPIGRDAMSVRREDYISQERKGNSSKEHHGKGTPWLKYLVYTGIFVVIIACCYYGYQYISQSDKLQESEIASDEYDDSTYDWESAVEYLRQNNTKWIESEMEKFPDLKGVYAMIRDFQFKELKKFIDDHSDLKYINEWERLYKIVEENNNKKGVWSTDGSIDVEKYLNTDFASKQDAKENDIPSDSSNGVEDYDSNHSSSVVSETTSKNNRPSNNKGHSNGKGNSTNKSNSGSKGNSNNKGISNDKETTNKSNSGSKGSSKGNNNQDNLN